MLPDVENRILKAARTDIVMFHVTKNNKKSIFADWHVSGFFL